jgi:PKD repeat protein
MSDTISICPPLLVRFSNKSTAAYSYRWDFGSGGSPVIVTNPVSTFSNPGVFTVTMVATDIYGCTDTATGQVRVLGYSGAFSYTPLNGCVPMQVNFTTPLNNIPQITWDFGDGVTSTGASTTATHTYLSARAYLPKVIFSDGATCASSSFGLDTIYADKIDADFNWSVPCVGTAFTLRDSSTAVYTAPGAWFWLFGGTTDTATGSPTSYTFPTPGNHSVTMIVGNATGCRDTLTQNVFVNDLPVINVTKDTGVCPGDRVDLQAGGAIRYTWSPAPDSMRNCPVCDIASCILMRQPPAFLPSIPLPEQTPMAASIEIVRRFSSSSKQRPP